MAQLDDASQSQAQPSAAGSPIGNPYLAMALAWLVPGLGHAYLRRPVRALLFFVLVLICLWVGCTLKGNLYQPVPGQPLFYLATAGTIGMGIPYFVLRFGFDYAGDIMGGGYEYGTAFLLTGGLMNWLLILDAWDISRGKKE